MSRRKNGDTRWGRRSKKALRSIIKLNMRAGDQRAKGKINYETGEVNLTWAPTDAISDLGDLAREDDDGS